MQGYIITVKTTYISQRYINRRSREEALLEMGVRMAEAEGDGYLEKREIEIREATEQDIDD